MNTIELNIEKIKNDISEACQKSGRKVDDISLMAVSKTYPLENIITAMNSGQKLFGENRVQEIKEKFIDFDFSKIDLHLIGHLQSNKVSDAVKYCNLIESVDSLKLIDKINSVAKQHNKNMSIFLEVNCSNEENKNGFTSEEQLLSALDCCGEMSNINFMGFMTMAPFTSDEKVLHNSFAKLREIKDRVKKDYPFFKDTLLSMGMSNDYKIAIEEGSNIVRIGTAIFGRR